MMEKFLAQSSIGSQQYILGKDGSLVHEVISFVNLLSMPSSIVLPWEQLVAIEMTNCWT
jgi:hypothetical protein